jgi:TP901 family phage tail tape measure protein
MAGNIKGITIEIDGNTTKFDRAIKDSNKEVNALNKELRNIDSSLKFNPGNVELLGQKQELLKQKTQAAKEKLEALKAAQADVEKQFASGEIDQGQYNKFQQEVIKAESQVKTFNGQLKETEKELKSMQGLSGVMNKVGDGFEKAGKKMSDIGGKLSKGVTAPIVAIGTAAGAAWKGIDDALDTIVTKTGATGDAMKEFEGNFKNVFTSIPADAQQVGDAIGELNTQFGLTGEALEQASTQMVQFAEINGTDITNSTIAAKQAMEQFGASIEELPGFLDTVTAAAQQTGQSTDSIFEAVKRGAPQLKAMGLDMNQSAMMMAKFQQAGLDSSKVLSSMTKAQVQFAKDGKTLQQGMEEFFQAVEQGGGSVDIINQASEIFGSKNGPMMVEAIQSGKISLEDFTASAQNYSGTVAETFDATRDPIDKMKESLNNLSMLGAELFNTIQEVAAPILEQLVEKVKGLREKWEELSPQTQQTIVKVAAIAAAIGPLLIVLGKMATGIGVVVKALSAFASPVGLAVAAVVGAVALIIANWDKIKKAWEDLKKFLVDTWNAIKTKAENIWNGIKKFFEDLWNGIKKTVETIWNAIKKFIEGIWNGLKTTAETVWNGVKGFFEGLWNGIKKTVETVWGGIKGFFEDTWNGLKSTAETLWNGVKSAVIDPVKDAAKEVWDKAKDMAKGFIDGVKDLPGKVGGIFKSAYEGIKGWVGKAIDKIRGLKKESDDYNNSPKAYSETGGTTIRGAGPAGGRAAYRTRVFAGLEAIGIDGLNWYDKGGIFKSPSVIGVGEKRPEFVGALDDLRKIVRDEAGKGYTIHIDRLEVREESDIDKIAKKLYELQRRDQRGRALC